MDVFEYGFSVGQVSGIIAGLISVVHLVVPIFLACIFIALLKDRTYKAATWTAISRVVQRSHLPDILGADGGVFGRSIAWHIRVIGISSAGVTILLFPVVGFLTPVPLYDVTRLSRNTKTVSFQYVPDTSYFGQGTPLRTGDSIKRVCDKSDFFADCPDSSLDTGETPDTRPGHINVNSTIPDSTLAPYLSTAFPPTVASITDIQYRNWYEGRWQHVDNGAVRQIGSPRPLGSMTTANGVQLVEGLVVDADEGIVCFRNHTAPTGVKLGARWDEDLLCVEPVTRCSRANFTLHFSISIETYLNRTDGFLVDEGAFAKLSTGPPAGPQWNHGDDWQIVGSSPDLQSRADIAGWWNARFTADSLLVDDKMRADNTYRTGFSNYSTYASTRSITITKIDGNYLDNNWAKNAANNQHAFTNYSIRCTGYEDQNPSSSNKPFMRCGYLYSVPNRLDDALQQRREDPGSNWTQSLYTCASSTKASVKTVSFMSNGTVALDAIKVIGMRTVSMSGNRPIRWGIESALGYNISDIALAWGLVSDEAQDSDSLQISDTPELYLPTASRSPSFNGLPDSFAAGNAFNAAWNSVYDTAAIIQGVSFGSVPMYTGGNNFPQAVRWANLSQTAEGAQTIINLIWTDLVASGVIGTTTGFPSPNAAADNVILGSRSVRPIVHDIGYANQLYAIPAYALLMVLLLLFVAFAILWCTPLLSFAAVKHYLNQTGMGRAIAQLEHPGISPTNATTKEWSREAGAMNINVPAIERRQTMRRDRHQYSGVDQEQSVPLRNLRSRGASPAALTPSTLAPHEVDQNNYFADSTALPRGMTGGDRSYIPDSNTRRTLRREDPHTPTTELPQTRY